jgi:predicted O-linked N-acetylglucosamine transferase (SPINDLY family)
VVLGHNPDRFQVFCYSDTRSEDDLTTRFRATIQGWRNVVGISDDQLAAMIRSDGIDILVDLVGHMANNRLLVFARKPAPIQVTAWGEPTGTGLKTMDYLFADSVLVPPRMRSLLAEEVIDLPCFLTYWTPDALPAPSLLPALRNGYVTFGCFNRITKISDAVLRCWSAILRTIPRSRLILKHHIQDEPHLHARIRSVFAQEGIEPERYSFLGYTDRPAHFAAYQEIDIALDPFPHGGGMTTLDALFMGVPVITSLGDTISSRLAAASLTALGLVEFIAPDRAAYVSLAVAKAADLPALTVLRESLRARMQRCPLGDNAAYTESVETAYGQIWRRWCATQADGTKRADGMH